MVLVRRLGGWRPVEASDGVGSLRLRDGGRLEDVRYGFEVWHQFAQGFHGPSRAEGRLTAGDAQLLRSLLGQRAVLELEDGRFLLLRIGPDGELLAHRAPQDDDPGPDALV